MSVAGAKQEELSIIAQIQAMETRMIERHADLKREMQTMANTHGDLRQLSANLTFLFGPEGTFNRTVNDVIRHNKYEVVTNFLVAVGLLIGGSSIFQGAKKLIGLK